MIMSAPTYHELDGMDLEGMEVFDVDGTKVGKVLRADKVLGYFETQGAFTGPRYIPFFAIARVEPSGIRLTVIKSVVSHVYNHPPAVRPDLLGHELGAVLVEVRDHDRRALTAEQQARRAADARGSTGDDGDLPVDSSHDPPRSVGRRLRRPR